MSAEGPEFGLSLSRPAEDKRGKNKPVSVAKSEKFWWATGHSNLAYKCLEAIKLAKFGFCTHTIGDFRVAFCLCFKVSPCAKPFIWKFVLFTRKFWFIYMRIKLVSI